MENNINLSIPATVYGNLDKYNEVISKGRCRTFYKYDNRNGTFITDEFAEKLLSTIPYTPVKGIYDNFDQDYTDHGEKRSLGRIYGIVPENPNLAWEKHLDEDGIEREYACVDVLIFTGLYEEAKQIIGKPQSMELYSDSIRGEWQIINGKKQYVFNEGCFLGLQVLGDEVEPCFEGASFFSLKPIKELLQEYDNFQKRGGKEMPSLNFKLSDNQKHEAIWSLLNTNYNQENGWTINYSICEIYDQYAVVRDYENNCFERVYYSKDDATDSLVLGDREKCFIVDVTEPERSALQVLQTLNGGTYTKVDENFSALKEENENFEHKKEEYENSISTLTTEKNEMEESLHSVTTQLNETQDKLDAANAAVEESAATINTLSNEVHSLTEKANELASFKAEVEKKEKISMVESYSKWLTEDEVDLFVSRVDEFTAEALKKDLAFTLVNNHSSIFEKQQKPSYVPKDQHLDGGIEEILSRY